jgi:hypothetical protein
MLRILIFTVSIFMFLCADVFGQVSKIDSSQMITLHIDPENARGAAVSQVFDEVRFIPLETTKESLFGSIGKIEIADNCFVIYDNDTRAVLIFDQDGKFKGKVGGSKTSSGSEKDGFSAPYGFTMKREGNNSLIRVISGSQVYLFDLNGKFVKKANVKDEAFGWGASFSDGTEIEDGKMLKDSTYYNLVLTKNNKDIAAYFPYTKERYKDDYFSSGISPLSNSDIPDEMFFVHFFDYNVYKVTTKKAFLAYRILFPATNSLPEDFKTNPVYKKKRRDYFLQNPNAIFSVNNVYKIGNNLFFKCPNLFAPRNKKNALIYNLKTGNILTIKDLEPDALSSFLPVTDAGAFADFSNHGFHLFDGNYLYTSYSSLAMFTFKEQNSAKNARYTPIMENYFNTQNRKSNPVLIQLKPKKD